MQDADREPLATVALIAAFADGYRAPEEVEQLKLIAREIGGGGDYDTIARQVLSGKSGLKDVVGRLSSDEARHKAFDLAVSVVYADGVANDKEKAFLKQLEGALNLDPAAATAVLDAAAAFAKGAEHAGPVPDVVAVTPDSSAGELDELVLKNAMLAGALELLPQNLAGLAVVPLQMRMVYKIGQDHGQKLDMGQVKDLAGAMGIGAAG
ncbi:MAG: GTPase, partial [Gemmatimonadales bacterium]